MFASAHSFLHKVIRSSIVLGLVVYGVMVWGGIPGRSQAASPLVGDANNDCVVDEKDFGVWVAYFLQNIRGGAEIGDFNASGTVDGVDYVLWLQHIGERCSVASSTGTVTTTQPHVPSQTSTSTPTSTRAPTTTPIYTPTPTYVIPTHSPTSIPATSTPIPTSSTVSHDQVSMWVDAYKAAHPGNGGKDWDINAKTSAQLAADPDAQRLVSLCGSNQRPVIPKIAWEYGGSDHPWINPQASALVYCVYTPVSSPTSHWQYNASTDRVTADVYVLFPNNNPCKNMTGKDQVIACLGDPTNSEILVDTVSLNDGHSAGLELSTASTLLYLILPDGTKVQLLLNL